MRVIVAVAGSVIDTFEFDAANVNAAGVGLTGVGLTGVGVGSVTFTVIVVEAERLALSVAVKVTLNVPALVGARVTVFPLIVAHAAEEE